MKLGLLRNKLVNDVIDRNVSQDRSHKSPKHAHEQNCVVNAGGRAGRVRQLLGLLLLDCSNLSMVISLLSPEPLVPVGEVQAAAKWLSMV